MMDIYIILVKAVKWSSHTHTEKNKPEHSLVNIIKIIYHIKR
jgi:hypothetical protein